MDTDLQEHVAYYLTGQPSGQDLTGAAGLGLRPALLARYPDLDALRYDLPVVLVDGATGAEAVLSLSGLLDDLMDEVTAGAESTDAGRLRHHAIRLEREIRKAFTAGDGTRLSALWTLAAGRLAEGADEQLADSLKRLTAARAVDGEVAGCDRELPERLIGHVWRAEAARKARRVRRDIDRLALGLADILQADDANSPAGVSADRLSGEFGPAFGDEIDFGTLSQVLTASRPETALPAARRTRIEGLLATLEGQRFFAAADVAGRPGAPEPYGFVFDGCATAVEAYRQRLPEMVALAKAMRVAELEVDGAYRAEAHDKVFEAVGAADLGPAELAQFPDYLVVTGAEGMEATEQAKLAEALSAGLPFKVMLQVDDLAGPAPRADGRVPAGDMARQLAHTAIGIGGVHVVQSAGSHLYRMREPIARGVTGSGPALLVVYSGAGGETGHLPPYLVSAAAVEARAFPVFAFEPSLGPEWADRISLDANPQPELDWPVHSVAFEDDTLQRVTEEVAFTLADFLVCDARHAARLARVPSEGWNGLLVPVAERVVAEDEVLPEVFPHLLLVDAEGGVHKALVERRVIHAARRCREQWRSLQELGGIHNSFAERLLARERAAWEEQAQLEADARMAEAAMAGVAPAPAPALDGEVAEGEEAAAPVVARDPDVTAIETARCSTCDECTKINNRMFKYNGNKQAVIADLNAGTYAEMVLAAERCQVAIIHPGKPWNADEPNLEELLERAAPFR